MKHLRSTIKSFMQLKSGASAKTSQQYVTGMEVLENYIRNYAYDSYGENSELSDISLEDIDQILGYFIIRKYMDGVTFRLVVARTLGSFFAYAADQGLYDRKMAAEIKKMTRYYANQYPRLENLETVLWDSVEGEVDRLMLLPEKQREQQLTGLRAKVKDATLQEGGYVTVSEIDGNMIFGQLMDLTTKVGPVLLDQAVIELLQPGDIINMITLRRLSDAKYWEIAELGYVYPRPYLDQIPDSLLHDLFGSNKGQV